MNSKSTGNATGTMGEDTAAANPPTYSQEDPNPVPASTLEDTGSPAVQLPTLKPGDVWELGHTPEKGRTGYEITKDDNTLFYAAHYYAVDKPDVVLYGGYDSTAPRLAQAMFLWLSKDFKIYVGDQKTPTEEAEYDLVTCEGGSMFKSPMFCFEARRTGDTLYWKKTSDRKLGASFLSPRDMKLVDRKTEEVVAVYAEHDNGAQAMYGSIKFHREITELSIVAALTVLMTILERNRRAKRLATQANARKVTY